MVSTLCLVACGQAKIWKKDPDAAAVQQAQDVYTGATARYMRYAKRFFPDSWQILSAKHGFLTPTDRIRDYNVTFNVKRTNPITVDKLIQQAIDRGLYQFDQIVVLGGKAYVETVKKVFPDHPVINLFDGCKGIGYQYQRIRQALERETPFVALA